MWPVRGHQRSIKVTPKMILTPLWELPKNVGNFGKINVAICFEKLPKSAINRPIWSHWLLVKLTKLLSTRMLVVTAMAVVLKPKMATRVDKQVFREKRQKYIPTFLVNLFRSTWHVSSAFDVSTLCRLTLYSLGRSPGLGVLGRDSWLKSL